MDDLTETDRDEDAEVLARVEKFKTYWSEQHQRMREDLAFSNPVDPQQWEPDAITARRTGSTPRPCEVFDFTNQNIMQVVNDFRNNKIAANILPTRGTDKKSAELMEGMLRHIDYESRAHIADETALEHSARVGLGFERITTDYVKGSKSIQQICVKRIVDPLTVLMDTCSVEPDGSDQKETFIVTSMKAELARHRWPKASLADKKDDEEVEAIERYWLDSDTVKWALYVGGEKIDEETIPGKYIPVVPFIGYEVWQDGKRMMCGITRRQRPSQIAYNYARNAEMEVSMAAPKAPWLVALEGISGLEEHWDSANSGNPSYLPYRSLDDQQRPLPQPNRISPAVISQAYIEMSQVALKDGERSIGMFAANLGAASNETSGKAINARARQGAIGNYHYMDGAVRAIEHRARVIMEMIPEVYDTKREQAILIGERATKTVTIDPSLNAASKRVGNKTLFNPSFGEYGLRVKAGPGFTTQRQEASEMLTEFARSNPAAAVAIAPILADMQDWPGSEKVAKVMLAIAPPQVQKALSEESDLPPEATAQIESAMAQAQQVQEQAQQAMQQMAEQMKKLQEELTIAKVNAANREQEAQLEMARYQVDLAKAESDKEVEYAKIAADREKAHLEAAAEADKLAIEERRRAQEAAIELIKLHMNPSQEPTNEAETETYPETEQAGEA